MARWPGTTTGSLVPLHDREGELSGVIWADDPDDRLVPSPDRLQALRMFANQAATALASTSPFEEMHFLADNDPLTAPRQPPRVHPPPAEEILRAAALGHVASPSCSATSTASRR